MVDVDEHGGLEEATVVVAPGAASEDARAGLARLLHVPVDDVELQRKVDGWVVSAGGYLVDNYRGEVSRMIESTVSRWDAESTSRRMELQVGRDLQFIRINGTVVGGLAGIVIHSLTEVF